MTHAAKSILAFATYLFGQGLILLIAPNFLLELFGLPATQEVWVRLVGVALLVLAYYYSRAAFSNLRSFFEFTVHGRTLQLVLIIGLVVLGHAPAILIGFAGFEFLTGVWTYVALRGEA